MMNRNGAYNHRGLKTFPTVSRVFGSVKGFQRLPRTYTQSFTFIYLDSTYVNRFFNSPMNDDVPFSFGCFCRSGSILVKGLCGTARGTNVNGIDGARGTKVDGIGGAGGTKVDGIAGGAAMVKHSLECQCIF